MNLLETRHLCIGHGRPGTETRLIEDIDLSLKDGEALGIVGASGSGKTLTACALAGLLPSPLRIVSGSIHFRGNLLAHDRPKTWRGLRGREILMLFQSPASALNGLVRVQDQIAEALEDVKGYRRAEALSRSIAILESVGITSDKAKAYPFQLSGGMRQRVLIALALALEPAVLIADEPAVGLDPIHHAEILQGDYRTFETADFRPATGSRPARSFVTFGELEVYGQRGTLPERSSSKRLGKHTSTSRDSMAAGSLSLMSKFRSNSILSGVIGSLAGP